MVASRSGPNIVLSNRKGMASIKRPVVSSNRLEMAKLGKFEVFFDGSCAFCQAARAWAELRDSENRLAFLDYNDPAVAVRVPFPRARLDAEMHVRKPDGTWVAGFAGWAAILRELPRYRWLGWIFGVFPLNRVGPGVYRWIARHRFRILGFPPPCTSESCAVPRNPAANPPAVARPHSR
jgi:predicted DCC family thiol-disulfide oxidoreductase YuxK